MNHTLTERTSVILFATLLFLFLLFSLTVIYDYPPVWPDETVFADTAYELAFHGRLATPVWSYVAEEMSERAVWYPPVHFMMLALVYRVFGFGIFQTRMLSVFFGLVSIIFLFLVSLRLTRGNRSVSLLVACLTMIDPVFIRGTIIGRGDIIVVGFILVAFACFLYLGARKVKYPLIGFLTGLATLIHPLGIIGFASIFIISLIGKNQGTRRSKNVLYLTLPFVFLLLLWSLYALKDLDRFVEQFFGQAGGQTTVQMSDVLFLLFFVKTYFYSTPAWLNNAYVFYLLFSCFAVIVLAILVFYMKNRGEWNTVMVFVFLAFSILAYTFGPLRHSMWYNIYVQPFLYLSVGLFFCNRSRLIECSSRKHDVLFKYVTSLSILVVVIFFLTVDALNLTRTLNSSMNYLEFGSEVLSLIPDDATVFIASTPDPYFVLKNSGKNLRLYTFVHMGSYPMEESYNRILADIDYFVFSGTPEKHFMSPYDVRLLNDFIRDNTTFHAVIGDSKDYYPAVVYKSRGNRD